MRAVEATILGAVHVAFIDYQGWLTPTGRHGVCGVVYTLFLQPRLSILHHTGQPNVQHFAGLNLKFPKN